MPSKEIEAMRRQKWVVNKKVELLRDEEALHYSNSVHV